MCDHSHRSVVNHAGVWYITPDCGISRRSVVYHAGVWYITPECGISRRSVVYHAGVWYITPDCGISHRFSAKKASRCLTAKLNSLKKDNVHISNSNCDLWDCNRISSVS